MKKKPVELKKKLLLHKETLIALEKRWHIYGGTPVTEDMNCGSWAETNCVTYPPDSPQCVFCF